MKPNIPKNSQFEKLWWKFWKSVYKRACFSGFTWGAKFLPSQNNWIASWMIWYCALRHGQRKLCEQYVGQGAAGQELFRVRTQKVCQNRLVLAQNDGCYVSWCQKHRFLAHSLKSVEMDQFFAKKEKSAIVALFCWIQDENTVKKCLYGTFSANVQFRNLHLRKIILFSI